MPSVLPRAAFGLLLSGCQYQAASEPPEVSGPFLGNVDLIWAPTTTGVTANFTAVQLADGGCLGTQTGACCSYAQPQIDLSQGGQEPTTVSAGTIAIADGRQTLGSLAFAGVGYKPLSSAENNALIWKPGDTLEVAAAGGQVGAFTGSIPAPPAFAGVSPDLTVTGQIVVRLDEDFTVTWTPPSSAAGPVTLELFDPTGFYVDCVAADSAGTITVPSAALASFISGDNGYLTLSRSASQSIAVADANVTLTAQATAPGLATFQ